VTRLWGDRPVSFDRSALIAETFVCGTSYWSFSVAASAKVEVLIGASGSGMPLALRLAHVGGDRQTRDGAGLAPEGLEGILALAVLAAGSVVGALSDASSSLGDMALGTLVGPAMTKAETGRLGFTVSARHRQMRLFRRPGSSSSWRSFLRQHTRTLGLRPLLRLDPVVPNSLCLFVIHHASHDGACSGAPASDSAPPLNMRYLLSRYGRCKRAVATDTFRWLCLEASISTLR
jgi:hypothetical protein